MSHFSDALRSAHSSLTAPSSSGRTGRGRIVTGSAVALAAALGLAGCASTGSSGDDTGDGLRVVTTTTQLTDFAQEIGGDEIALTGLLPAGGSAHHYDPSPDDLLALGQADVLIVNGAGLETFIDDAVESSGFDGTIVDASQGVDLAEAEEITTEAEHEAGESHDHAEEGDDHGHDHDHAEEGEDGHDHADEGDEHDHDHGPVNPHLWTSPEYAKGMATEVMDGLVEADPDHADDYTSRGDAYTAKLDELDAWVAQEMAKVPEADRIMVSGHDSLRYYLHDYDIAFAGSILPSFEDNAEPSAAEIDALVHEIQERGVKAVFVESSMNPKLAETIAQEAGVEVVDSDAIYADSLGAEDTDAATYIGATVHNTKLMLDAWGVTPDEVPADLES